MAWSATLDSVTKSGGNVVASVTFTDGVETIVEKFNGDTLDEAAIMRLVKRRIESLNSRDANAAALSGKVGATVTPTVDDVATVEATEFFAKLETHRKAQKAVSLGLVAADAKAVTDAATAAREAFRPRFINDHRFPAN